MDIDVLEEVREHKGIEAIRLQEIPQAFWAWSSRWRSGAEQRAMCS